MFLLRVLILTGLLAGEQAKTHYTLSNSTLCLDVDVSKPVKYSEWKVNETIITTTLDLNPNFTNKVDFHPENFSLCLKRLQDTDTGTYRFKFVGDFKDSLVSHRVIVEDVVPRPVIMISQLQTNQSGPCTFRVNCSVLSEWYGLLCIEDNCTATSKTFDKVNIIVSIDKRTVVCVGSNHISTNKVSQTLGHVCPNQFHGERPGLTKTYLNTIIIFVIVAFICLILVFMAMMCFSKGKYQQPPARFLQRKPFEQPRLSTISSTSLDHPYENIDAEQMDLGSWAGQNVNTLYSVVRKPTKVLPSPVFEENVCKETNEPTSGDTATSQAVVVHDWTERSEEITTIYCLLQKHTNPKS